MMIETSAVLAVLLNEPERAEILDVIEAAAKPFTTAVVVAEAAMAFAKRTGIAPSAALDAIQTFLDEAAIYTVAFVPAMIGRAIEGREKFGKGRTPLRSTSATASPTAPPATIALRCFSKATTSPKQT